MTAEPSEPVDWTRLLGAKLLDKRDGQQVEVPTQAALQGKRVGIYFSAHWCPPCRQFTPSLAKTYSKLKKDGADFEVVFVSMDRNPEQFAGYFAEQPWLAVPFVDDQLRSVLSRKFSVAGIPCLVMLDADSTVLSANARSAVGVDPAGEAFPWAGAKEPRGFPIPWLLLLLLLFWALNTFLFPPKPKAS